MVLDKFVYDSDKKTGPDHPRSDQGRLPLHHRRRLQAHLPDPHAQRFDHRARHHLRCLHFARRQRLAAAARRRHRGDRRRRTSATCSIGRASSSVSTATGRSASRSTGGYARPRCRRSSTLPSRSSAHTPQIEPVPTTTRDVIEQASFPRAEPKACVNAAKPKTQKAEITTTSRQEEEKAPGFERRRQLRSAAAQDVKRKPKYEEAGR